MQNAHLSIVAHSEYKADGDDPYASYDSFYNKVYNSQALCIQPPFKKKPVVNLTQHSQGEDLHFDGTISDWTSYFDSLISTIDSNGSLAPSQKFLYLKTTFIGEPLTLIKSLRLTDVNYTAALEILKSRYNR